MPVTTSNNCGDWCSPARRIELDAALEVYLIAIAEEPGLRLWTTARILRPKLERLVSSGARNPALRYALLTAWEQRLLVLQKFRQHDGILDRNSDEASPSPVANRLFASLLGTWCK